MKRKNKIQFKGGGKFKIIAGFILAIIFLFGGNFDGLSKNRHINTIGNKILTVENVLAADSTLTPEEQKAQEEQKKLEEKAKKTKDKISDLNKKKKKYESKKQKATAEASAIKGGIYELSKNITNIQGEVKETEKTLKQIEDDIKEKEKEIIKERETMGSIIRKINRQKINLKMTMLDGEKGLDDYIRSRDTMESLQKDILRQLNTLKEERRNLEKVKREKKETKEKLDSQKSGLEREKNKKYWLLNQKNKEIIEHDKKIKGIQRKIDKLNSALSSFLGKSFNTNDIVQAIKFASKKTGVRKEFLMAMLDKETDLGRFTGGCTYKNTRMKSADKAEFKKICKSLGYNYKKKKISCSLSYGYGGAMGVAQFMPTTWIGYKNAISNYTGHRPPDPWSLVDGVMGMAEKLRRAGANKKSKEHYAAKAYYCGGPGSRYWNTHCEAYADTVISWAKGGYKEYF